MKYFKFSIIKCVTGYMYNIIIWDYFNFELDDRCFYDENHLNEDGASIFSVFINAKLEKAKKSFEW